MTPKEARKKYKKYWKKMQPHLIGMTVVVKDNGETDIPERDLEFAYDMATKGHTNLMWD